MIQDTSEECSAGATELFTTPPTQTSIVKRRTIHVYPSPAIVTDAPIEFYIPASDEHYTNLNHALLLDVKIVKSDNGSALTAEDDNKVGLSNFPLHALFSQVDVYINDRLVTSSANTYSYSAVFEKLLTYDAQTLEYQFSSELIKLDEKLDTVDGSNAGWKARAAYTNQSKTVTLRGSLHIPILRQERLLLNQCSVKIKLHPNNRKFYLMAAADSYKLDIVSARFELEKLEMNPDLLNEHADKLRKQNAIYPIRRGEMKTFSIPAGNTSAVKENLFVGKLPRRLIVAKVDSEAYNGKISLNPFNFQPFGLNYLCAYVDGERYPTKALQPDFTNGKFLDCLGSLYDGTGMRNDDRTLAIRRENYAEGYALYVIHMSPGEPDCPAYDLSQKGNIRLEMKFNGPLAKTITTLVYAEYDDQLEIDNDRNIMIDV